MSLLAGFVSLTQTRTTWEEERSTLRTHLHQLGLVISELVRGGIFLLNDCCERLQPTVHLWSGVPGLYAEQAVENKSVRQGSPLSLEGPVLAEDT